MVQPSRVLLYYRFTNIYVLIIGNSRFPGYILNPSAAGGVHAPVLGGGIFDLIPI